MKKKRLDLKTKKPFSAILEFLILMVGKGFYALPMQCWASQLVTLYIILKMLCLTVISLSFNLLFRELVFETLDIILHDLFYFCRYSSLYVASPKQSYLCCNVSWLLYGTFNCEWISCLPSQVFRNPV